MKILGVVVWVLVSVAMYGQSAERVVPGRLVVVYAPGRVAEAAGLLRRMPRLGMAVVAGDQGVERRLRAEAGVVAVLHDRYTVGHALQVRRAVPVEVPRIPAGSFARRTGMDSMGGDGLYESPQGWAVRAAGGFGNGVPGGPVVGPWTTSMGAGVRIAVLDSGMDAGHPDLAPNLVMNVSEVDSAALPSVCDTGSAEDQQGHGTWVGSLAAGAVGPATGEVVGVAPQASLLNIKVLERMPGASGCAQGEAGGLLSWVLQGIEDAVANRAGVISISLGTLVDTSTGDGAGWKAAFDRATYAATEAGAVVVAAAGNDGVQLGSTLVELPAQSRGVLAVTATTNPDCAEDLRVGAVCRPGIVARASYSNFGVGQTAVAVPGGNAPAGDAGQVSGMIWGACSRLGCFDEGPAAYVQAMGTSASAALMAGAVAVLRAARPEWTAAQVLAAIRATAVGMAGGDAALNLPAAMALP